MGSELNKYEVPVTGNTRIQAGGREWEGMIGVSDYRTIVLSA
jgi:hypothetical protein